MSSDSKYKLEHISKFLIYAAAISFILLFVVLSFYNRVSEDDFDFLVIAERNNIWDFTIKLCQTLCGRWASWLYFYFIIKLSPNFQSLHFAFFGYYIFSLFLFVFAISKIIKHLVKELFDFSINLFTAIPYSILLIGSFYFSTFQNIEVWWYMCASFHYLQGIIFFVVGLSFLLDNEKKKFDYFFSTICFAISGGCFELYPIIVFALLFSFILFLVFIQKVAINKIKSRFLNTKTIIAFSFFTLSSVICLFSGGNFARRISFVENISLYKTEIDWTALITLFYDKKYLFSLIISSGWFLLGSSVRKNTTTFFSLNKLYPIIGFSFFTILISAFIVFLFSELLTYGIFPPERAWTFTSFCISIFFCITFFAIGHHFDSKYFLFKELVQLLLPLLISFLLLGEVYIQYNYVSNYSKKYDELIASFIEAKKRNEKIFYMESLPNSGMLMQLNMESKRLSPTSLKRILKLNFDIKVKH